jgi:hypothetical protein
MMYRILNHTGIQIKFWPSSQEDREMITSLSDDMRNISTENKDKQTDRTLLEGRGRMSYTSSSTHGRRVVIEYIYVYIGKRFYLFSRTSIGSH